jgi:hypothetical protein
MCRIHRKQVTNERGKHEERKEAGRTEVKGEGKNLFIYFPCSLKPVAQRPAADLKVLAC